MDHQGTEITKDILQILTWKYPNKTSLYKYKISCEKRFGVDIQPKLSGL